LELKWFEPYPMNTFEPVEKGPLLSVRAWLTISAVVMVMVLYVITPGFPLKVLASYVVLGVFSLWWMESEGEGEDYVATVGFKPNHGLIELIMLGFFLPIAFFIIGKGAGIWTLEFASLGKMLSMSTGLAYFFMVIIVPILESTFFGACFSPSAVEQGGVLAGMVSSALLFFGFHFVSWFPLSLYALGLLGGFRAINTLIIAKYRSYLANLISHMVLNFMVASLVIA